MFLFLEVARKITHWTFSRELEAQQKTRRRIEHQGRMYQAHVNSELKQNPRRAEQQKRIYTTHINHETKLVDKNISHAEAAIMSLES